jgi:hypothetical protein
MSVPHFTNEYTSERNERMSAVTMKRIAKEKKALARKINKHGEDAVSGRDKAKFQRSVGRMTKQFGREQAEAEESDY